MSSDDEKPETPEQERISGLLFKNAQEAMWKIYTLRVQKILDQQKKEFMANLDAPIHTSHVMMPPDRKQVEELAAGLMGGMMFERNEIEYEIGTLLEESLGETTRNPEVRAALARIISVIRARGPRERTTDWQGVGVGHDWGEAIEKEIADNTAESVKARFLRRRAARAAAAAGTTHAARYDADKQEWSVEHVDTGGPGQRDTAGAATTELAVGAPDDAKPAGEAAGGGGDVAGGKRRRGAKTARRAHRKG